MSSVKVILLMVLLGLMTNTALKAQDSDVKKDELFLLGRTLPDSILLRWAPSTYRLWLVGNTYGYRVTRTTLMKDGKILENRQERLLTPEPLKPRSLDEWEKLDGCDEYAGIAAHSIYGDGFDVSLGGSNTGMVDLFNKATIQENKFGFALYAADMSVNVAKYHGLMYVDKDVVKGEKYIYNVFLDRVPEDMKRDTLVLFTGVDETLPIPAPADFKAEAGDRQIILTWDNKYQKQFYNSFWIERSADNGNTFKRLNNKPFLNTTAPGYEEAPFHHYIDTIATNGLSYAYRIIGITVFGELSPPSEVLKINGLNLITQAASINKTYSTDGISLTLNWSFANDNKEVIDGFRLFRSKQFDTGYVLIADSLPLTSSSYIDTKPLYNAYYRLQAFNKDGDGPMGLPKMAQVVDSIPPLAPTGLSAKADTSGLVTITWNANTDDDIYGYRIYRANATHEEYSSIIASPVVDTVYIDQVEIKTLTKNVFYKIKAYDLRQNQSAFSEVLMVERPDIVPPSPPLITSITPSDSGIVILWINSISEDVDKQLLYRNRVGSNDWKLIKTFYPVGDTMYNDVPDLNNAIYRYLLIAVDKAGNECKPLKPVSAKYAANTHKQVWITPKVKSYKRDKVVRISWDAPAFPVSRFLIYTCEPKGQWHLIDGVGGSVYEFESTFYYGQKNAYKIKSVE